VFLTKWQTLEGGKFLFLSLLQIELLPCLDFMSLALSERQCLAITGPNWQEGFGRKTKRQVQAGPS
jgi:hypothetical protein